MAWFKYLPTVLLFRNTLFTNMRRIIRRILCRRSTINPVVNEGREISNTTEAEEEKINRIRAATMANMECGEDISYLMAAFMMLPYR